jgi:hypothetical protein
MFLDGDRQVEIMKIKFLATGIAPDYYIITGEQIAYNNELYDLSEFEEGDKFLGVDDFGIREIERINGELYVTLCQKAPIGHWCGNDEYIDSSEYNPSCVYIKEVSLHGELKNQEEI